MVEKEDGKIVFLSTCTGLAGYHTDDRVAASKIRDRMRSDAREHATIITDEATPQQLVSLYRDIDIHVGTRMHSCVLAMLAKTPVVAIEYQFKTSGMMAQIGLEEYVLDIDGVSSADLLEAISEARREKSSIERTLEESVPKLRDAAHENARILREEIGN